MKRLVATAALLVFGFLTFFGITRFGLVGPDEPRYASIGREMAASGDWITPRLWGTPWFEKPALLYWVEAAAFRLGLGDELAPRLPIAICGFAFLGFFFRYVWLEFNLFVASCATALLATSAMWVGFTHVAVTDLLLATTFGAAILLLLPLVEQRDGAANAAAALLGLSVLAKGLVPLVLAAPFLVFGRKAWRKWLRPGPVLLFCAIAVPWYALCQRQNPDFFGVFFVRHQLGRFATAELQHVQPWWFYGPVLLAAFFPSVPLALFALSPHIYHDRRRRFLAAIVLWGAFFFSASRNKLPGYLLPLLPIICVLAGAGIEAALELRSRWLRIALGISPLMLALVPASREMLPEVITVGFRQALADVQGSVWPTVGGLLGAVAAAFALARISSVKALVGWFALASAGWIYLEATALPDVDRLASARSVWRGLPEPKMTFCVCPISRDWRYGLNYYAGRRLPDCAANSSARAVVPAVRPGMPPVIIP